MKGVKKMPNAATRYERAIHMDGAAAVKKNRKKAIAMYERNKIKY